MTSSAEVITIIIMITRALRERKPPPQPPNLYMKIKSITLLRVLN